MSSALYEPLIGGWGNALSYSSIFFQKICSLSVLDVVFGEIFPINWTKFVWSLSSILFTLASLVLWLKVRFVFSDSTNLRVAQYRGYKLSLPLLQALGKTWLNRLGYNFLSSHDNIIPALKHWYLSHLTWACGKLGIMGRPSWPLLCVFLLPPFCSPILKPYLNAKMKLIAIKLFKFFQ